MPRAGLEPGSDAGSSQVLIGNPADSEASEAHRPSPPRLSAEPTVTLSHDDVSRALENARVAWAHSPDPAVLRKALLELLRNLEGSE